MLYQAELRALILLTVRQGFIKVPLGFAAMQDTSTTEGPAFERLLEGITLAFERYELIEVAGKGGQSLVYSAVDRRTGVHVALKTSRLVTADHLAHERETLHRLAQRGIAGIPSVYDFSKEYLALTFLPGEPLHQHPIFGMLEDRARRLLPLCDTLSSVHGTGYAHGDIKPANVLLGREPALIDFGSARPIRSPPHEKCVGTLRYFSPEQHQGVTSAESDQYSLAIVFYEFLTRQRLPFPTHWPDMDSSLISLDALPLELRPAMSRALAHSPQERYASVSDFKKDLESALQRL